jgi:purine-nucleoside phosphorylase
MADGPPPIAGRKHHDSPSLFTPEKLLREARRQLALPAGSVPPIMVGPVWTTDAPLRETAEAVDQARREGILAVEMEAAALYAFAQARGRAVVCFAQVTNQMATIDGDFEKGDAQGSQAALRVIGLTAAAIAGRPYAHPDTRSAGIGDSVSSLAARRAGSHT